MKANDLIHEFEEHWRRILAPEPGVQKYATRDNGGVGFVASMALESPSIAGGHRKPAFLRERLFTESLWWYRGSSPILVFVL